MAPHWPAVVSWVVLGLGVAGGLVVLADEFLIGNRQHMWVMNLVHPITALYWGPSMAVGVLPKRSQGGPTGRA